MLKSIPTSDKRTSHAPRRQPGCGPTERRGSRLWGNGLVALFLLLAAGFGFLGSQGPGPSASNQQAAPAAVRFRPIEDYRVCDRVLGENPELTAEDRAKFGPEPDPATWRKLEFALPEARRQLGRRNDGATAVLAGRAAHG